MSDDVATPLHASQIVGAKVTLMACQACGADVRVECGDVSGMTFDDVITEAQDKARAICPNHEPVSVGADAPDPRDAQTVAVRTLTGVGGGPFLVIEDEWKDKLVDVWGRGLTVIDSGDLASLREAIARLTRRPGGAG